MGRLRNLAKRAAERVARRAARDELFEKPGERASTPRLAPAPKVEAAPVTGAVPEALVTPADSAGVLAACRPDGRPLLVHHWATWCAPCIDELPEVQALFEAMGGAGRLIGVSWDCFEAPGAPESVAEEVEAFASERGLTWRSLLVSDGPEALFAALSLPYQKIPQTQLFDGQGGLVMSVEGAMSAAQLKRAHALLSAPG